MSSKEGYILRQWPASYYIPEGRKWLAKKWVNGTLFLSSKGVTFTEISNKAQTDPKTVKVQFVEFAELKKSSSTLVFSAIVIETKETTHWFGSLPNRDAVFLVIEHFWRERLIAEPKTPQKKREKRTEMGTRLLSLTNDSEKTLGNAGTMLKRQGEQLENAMGIMYDMHNDLDIAEKFISGFESWLGNWRLSKVYKTDPIELIDPNNVPSVYDFPVIYKSELLPNQNLETGTLRLSKDGITIIDKKQLNVYHYSQRNVSSIKVISPWEVSISKFRIGEQDICFTVMSTRMVQILKIVEPLYNEKFDLMEPPPGGMLLERGVSTDQSSRSSSVSMESGEVSPPPVVQSIHLSSPLVLTSNPSTSSHPHPGGGPQLQAQVDTNQRSHIVSEEEAEELRGMVERMKYMASGIALEQDSQLEKIDALTDSVNRANHRLKADGSRIKKLF